MISVGQGKYKVWLKEETLDNGIIFIIGGGEVSHIGSIVFSEPVMNGKTFSCTSQVINVQGHKEEIIARELTEKICLKKKLPVICVCGMHVNNATKKEIEILVDNAKKLLKKILEE
ncbi:MAG: hypothetical protein NTW30_05260 [Candidatus Aenigmarchaeota archaeon]|nr:hypothetical protein [Candidatus Aenigmarchaeota archaeon]